MTARVGSDFGAKSDGADLRPLLPGSWEISTSNKTRIAGRVKRTLGGGAAGPQLFDSFRAGQNPRPGGIAVSWPDGEKTEVLHWIAEGKSNEAVSILLAMSKRTVEKHVEHILAKLGVETRVEAVVRAIERRGLK